MNRPLKQSVAKPGEEVIVERIPKCDFCGAPAEYDGKTKHGPWAFMCDSDMKQRGIGVGLGRGQRLLLRSKS